MHKNIHTLIPDIYRLVGGTDGITSLLASDIGANIAGAIQTSLGSQERRGLRLSGLGPRCPRALWYSCNAPELAEPLPPYAKIKYTYGHIIEHLVIGLAKAAGHSVQGEQDEISVDGVVGHRDCIIDGCIVDVKSAATRSFQKFKDGSIKTDDPFGYLVQLDGYLVGSLDDPLVQVKDRAYLLAVDKTLGHMVLYEHEIRPTSLHDRIADCKRIVSQSEPPRCTCGIVPEGKSGNVKLDMQASYSPFKHLCFPNQIRTFLYANGPVDLIKVVRLPDVPELTRTRGKTLH